MVQQTELTSSIPVIIPRSDYLNNNELSTGSPTANTSSVSAVTPMHHHPDTILDGLSISRSSGTPASSPDTSSVSSDIVEQQPSDLPSPSGKTVISVVARELASTNFEDVGSVSAGVLLEALLIDAGEEEEEDGDGWDFKCIGLDHDPACPGEGVGGD
ncbi:hypothetical protein BDD12DRAFT_803473 [Trichophaea hybrida]|nr:hypothetical protein BDD12DRAFT_803473 [Trichophaea hybrida]